MSKKVFRNDICFCFSTYSIELKIIERDFIIFADPLLCGIDCRTTFAELRANADKIMQREK